MLYLISKSELPRPQSQNLYSFGSLKAMAQARLFITSVYEAYFKRKTQMQTKVTLA